MYSEAYEKPGVIVCPSCFAPLYPRKTTKVMTCRYCGTLLVIREGKGHKVKKGDVWYWFSSTELRDGVIGVVKTSEHTVEFAEDGKMIVDGTEKNSGEFGVVEYIWGEVPVMAVPKKILEI